MIRVETKDIMDLPNDFASECDLAYTDPPWEPRMVKWFETLMRKSGHHPPSNDIDKILQRLFSLTPKGIPMFICYGSLGYERVISIAAEDGRKFVQKIEEVQTTNHSCWVLQFDSDMPMPEKACKPFESLQRVIDWHRPSTIFEPFAGLGKLVKVMAKNGCNVVANEMNPERARKIPLQ